MAAAFSRVAFASNAYEVEHNIVLSAATASYSQVKNNAALVKKSNLTLSGVTYTFNTYGAAVRRNYYLTAQEASGTENPGFQPSAFASSAFETTARSFRVTGYPSTPQNGHTLVAGTNAFSSAGYAATTIAARKFNTTTAGYQGVYSSVGSNAALTHKAILYAAAASISVSGRTAGVAASRNLSFGSATFTITGRTAATTAARSLPAQEASGTENPAFAQSAFSSAAFETTARSFRIAGYPTIPQLGHSLDANRGTISSTGYAASLVATRKFNTTTGGYQGVYSYAGFIATLLRRAIMMAATGTFTESSNSAAVTATRKVSFSGATFTLSGNTATTVAARYLAAQEASGTENPAFAASAFASSAFETTARSFRVAGYNGVLAHGYSVIAAYGTITATGYANSLRAARSLPASYKVVTTAGNSAAVTATRKFAAATKSLTVTGYADSMVCGRKLFGAVGSFNLTGNIAGLKATRKLSLNYGSVSLSGKQAALARALRLTSAYGSIVTTGNIAKTVHGYWIYPVQAKYPQVGFNARLYESSFFYTDREIIFVPAETNTVALDYERRWITLPVRKTLAEQSEYRTSVAESRVRAA